MGTLPRPSLRGKGDALLNNHIPPKKFLPAIYLLPLLPSAFGWDTVQDFFFSLVPIATSSTGPESVTVLSPPTGALSITGTGALSVFFP